MIPALQCPQTSTMVFIFSLQSFPRVSRSAPKSSPKTLGFSIYIHLCVSKKSIELLGFTSVNTGKWPLQHQASNSYCPFVTSGITTLNLYQATYFCWALQRWLMPVVKLNLCPMLNVGHQCCSGGCLPLQHLESSLSLLIITDAIPLLLKIAPLSSIELITSKNTIYHK